MAQNSERVTSREDEEIELMDYLIVLWKRKWLIILGTFICVITAGIVAFNMTKIYGVSTSISIGKTKAGFIEGGSIVSERIKSIPMRKEIAQKLSLPLIEISGEDFFRVSIRENKDSLIAEIKRETAKPDQAIKILAIVNASIVRDHQSEVKKAKKELLDKIIINEDLIKIKKQTQKTLKAQSDEIEREIEALKEIRSSIIQRKIKEVDVVGMAAYFNDLQARLNFYYNTELKIIDQIPSQIQFYQTEIINLQAKLGKIKETKIINPPHSSYSLIRPQKKRILAIATALSFMVLIFLAFFLEYVEKCRKRSLRNGQ